MGHDHKPPSGPEAKPDCGAAHGAEHDHAAHDHAAHDHAAHDHDHAAHAQDHDDDHGHDHGHSDAHGDGHGHAHGHAHAHGPTQGRAFLIGIGLNSLFTLAAIIGGLVAHSMALLADGVHNLSDVLGLGLAWGAAHLAQRRPSQRHTYGLRSTTILAALTNAVLLLIVVGGVAWEAVLRLRHPAPVQGSIVLALAALGVVTNGLSALLFLRDVKRTRTCAALFCTWRRTPASPWRWW